MFFVENSRLQAACQIPEVSMKSVPPPPSLPPFLPPSDVLLYRPMLIDLRRSSVRRYMSFEELAFFPMFLPEPILPALEFPRLLAPNDVNVNSQILKR